MLESVREQLMQPNRLYKEGNKRYYETAAKLGVSSSALMILYGLCHAGQSCTQKELCDTWYLKKTDLAFCAESAIEVRRHLCRTIT